MLFSFFKKGFIFSTLALLLLAEQNADATLILGYFSEEADFTPIQYEDPNFEWSRNFVDETEWPANLKQSEESETEETFINKRLQDLAKSPEYQEINPNSNQAPGVVWVPTTIWDLFVIRHFALSDSYWQIITYAQNQYSFNLFGDNRNKTKTDIFVAFMEYFQSKVKIRLSALSDNPKVISNLVFNILCDIEKIKATSFLAKKSKEQIETLKAIFRPEASAIRKAEPSFLLAIIKTEIEAHNKNLALLWRSTAGVVYRLEANEIPEFTKGHTLAKKTWNNFITQVFHFSPNKTKPTTRSEAEKKVLDFPTWTTDSAETVSLLKTEALRHLGFSFSYSPLAGFLLDGIFLKSSACSFVYSVRDNYKYTYFLLLDKKWLRTEGQELFYTPSTSPSDGIFSRGENFHPRTHKALFQRGDDFSTPISYIPSAPTSEENAKLQKLKIIYGERFSQHNEEQISLLAEFLLASVNFDSQISKVLAKQARILRIGTRIIEDSALDPECQTVMLYQQQATYLLNQKLKWLFIHQQLKNQLHICIEHT